MALVILLKQQSKWISKNDEDSQVHMLKSIWSKRRLVLSKKTLNVFETYYTTQSNFVDNESVVILNKQTNVTRKQIKQWFANRRSRAAKSCNMLR